MANATIITLIHGIVILDCVDIDIPAGFGVVVFDGLITNGIC
jgi:hypothetical protein